MDKTIRKNSECLVGRTVKADNSLSSIRSASSGIRKNFCKKCYAPLAVTIKKEIVCPYCDTHNLNN